MTGDDTPGAVPFGTAATGLETLGARRSREAARIRATARAECAQRRARVLRYSDLIAAMARPPLRLDAWRWNGYVPPRTDQEQLPEVLHSGGPLGRGYPNRSSRMTGPTEMNFSPARDALVAICAEAYRRDAAAGLAPAVPGASEPAGSPDGAGPAQIEAAPAQAALDWPAGSNGQAAQ